MTLDPFPPPPAQPAKNRLRPSRHPALARLRADARLSEAEADNAIACAAEGYAFPTNLDPDPPVGGLAPKTQADPAREALRAGTAGEACAALIREHAARRAP